MDSRIPKPSGWKKPASTTTGTFDFSSMKFEKPVEEQKKQPLSEINNKSFAAFPSTHRARARSPEVSSFRTQSIAAQPKLRRSKSAMDIRGPPLRGIQGIKRTFKTTLETIPNKRLKTGAATMKPLPIKTIEKKAAIISTLKSNSASNVVTMAVKKLPLTKSTSSDGPTTSKFATTSKFTAKAMTSKTPAPTAAKSTVKTARPAPYDFKARHALLLEKFNVLKSKNEEQREQLTTLEERNEAADEREDELNQKLTAIENELRAANDDKIRLSEEIAELKGANRNLTTRNKALADSLAQTAEELTDVKTRQVELEKIAQDYVKLKEVSGTLEQSLKDTTSRLQMSQDQLYQINIERMILHNQVLDLRGNIRVFARVRPPVGRVEDEKLLCEWAFNDETSLEISNNDFMAAGATRRQTKQEFNFDQVFNPSTTQDEIFEMVSPLIQSAMDGYNVCIFAYGQTGSGKTFTMDGDTDHLGIIPRTVRLLFNSIETASVLGWSYTVTASFLEIYNEVLYDLLSNEDKEIEIRMANPKSKTEIYVSNIEQREVTKASQLYELMRIARSNRATAATAGNERSSRSHAVTRLEVIGKHENRPEKLIGFINLVDLAGSESPKTSQRMEETKSINRSLSELSNVILALVQKNEHVPYRNSKLTHLLMPSLGGNSKTLMFVNVSPFQDHFGESVKSLRFAATVNSCKLAKAKRNKQLAVNNA